MLLAVGRQLGRQIDVIHCLATSFLIRPKASSISSLPPRIISKASSRIATISLLVRTGSGPAGSNVGGSGDLLSDASLRVIGVPSCAAPREQEEELLEFCIVLLSKVICCGILLQDYYEAVAKKKADPAYTHGDKLQLKSAGKTSTQVDFKYEPMQSNNMLIFSSLGGGEH